MGREERPLLLAEVLDRVAHRGIVAAAPDEPQPPGGWAISSTWWPLGAIASARFEPHRSRFGVTLEAALLQPLDVRS